MEIYQIRSSFKRLSSRACKSIILSLSFLIVMVGCSFSKEADSSSGSQSPQPSPERHSSIVQTSLPEGVFKRRSPKYYEPDTLTIIHPSSTNNNDKYSCAIVSVGKINTVIGSIMPPSIDTPDTYYLKDDEHSTTGRLRIKQKDKNTLLILGSPPKTFQRVGSSSLTLATKEMQMDSKIIKECLAGRYYIKRICQESNPPNGPAKNCIIWEEVLNIR
jgi:hypothetical protein